jgi:uncharacterized protein (DUF488 family)
MNKFTEAYLYVCSTGQREENFVETIYTIGFAGKSLREFIAILKKAGVTRVVDIRLHNTSQLAGYAKKDDLAYVLELVDIEYVHRVDLAPDDELFNGYKKKQMDWQAYEKRYHEILQERNIAEMCGDIASPGVIALLCSEEKAERCHRRLLAEYLRDHCIPEAKITHL